MEKLNLSLEKAENDILNAVQLVNEYDWQPGSKFETEEEVWSRKYKLFDKCGSFTAKWKESNVPPKKPSLDWLSIRHDIFELDDKDEKIDFYMKNSGFEPFVLEHLSNIKFDRLPEFDELDRMVSPSPAGFFENTPENCVSLFEFTFGNRGFHIDKLAELGDTSAAVRSQYYKQPRSVVDYCAEVWKKHKEAKQKVQEQQK